MKVLVDPFIGTIHGVYLEPLNFDISAHYVIDIPQLIGTVTPDTDGDVPDLIAAKVGAWQAYVNSNFHFTGTTLYDELIGPTVEPPVNVDPTNSSGIELSVRKRTIIHPGGTLLTNPMTGPGSPVAVFMHYFGFSLYRAPVDPNNPTNPTPGPAKVLYSFNPNTMQFETFQTSAFTVTVCQASSPFTDVGTIVPDGQASISIPSSFRLKFINNAPIPYHLSDWILIYS